MRSLEQYLQISISRLQPGSQTRIKRYWLQLGGTIWQILFHSFSKDRIRKMFELVDQIIIFSSAICQCNRIGLLKTKKKVPFAVKDHTQQALLPTNLSKTHTRQKFTKLTGEFSHCTRNMQGRKCDSQVWQGTSELIFFSENLGKNAKACVLPAALMIILPGLELCTKSKQGALFPCIIYFLCPCLNLFKILGLLHKIGKKNYASRGVVFCIPLALALALTSTQSYMEHQTWIHIS